VEGGGVQGPISYREGGLYTVLATLLIRTTGYCAWAIEFEFKTPRR